MSSNQEMVDYLIGVVALCSSNIIEAFRMVDRAKELVKFGSDNLKKYKFKNAKIVEAEYELGINGEVFNRILAAAKEFPYELSKQLKVGGKIVIPVQNSIYEMTKEKNGELEGVEHYGFTFVPLIC